MKKVTMQDIADQLDISRITVWKALNEHPGVSDTLRQEIYNTAAKIGYRHIAKNHLTKEENSSTSIYSEKTVAVVVSRPESSLFWATIIHQLAKELTLMGINLMYSYIPSSYQEGYILPNMLSNSTISGMIIMNVYDKTFLETLNQLKAPKVFLDIVTEMDETELTGDLFLIDGKKAIYEITKDIIGQGLTSLGFIGDIAYARSNYRRYQGFEEAMMEQGIPIITKLSLTKRIPINAYEGEINDFLAGLPKMPEAFVCASDYIVSHVTKYLNTMGYRIPEDIILSGFDGTTEYITNAESYTSVKVDTHRLGKRLARQLLYRIEYPDSPCETIYINYPDILWSKSTLR